MGGSEGGRGQKQTDMTDMTGRGLGPPRTGEEGWGVGWGTGVCRGVVMG